MRDWQGMSSWLHTRVSGREIDQDPGGVIDRQLCLVPSWCEAIRTIRDCHGRPQGGTKCAKEPEIFRKREVTNLIPIN